jgi:hypothetical protein
VFRILLAKTPLRLGIARFGNGEEKLDAHGEQTANRRNGRCL